MNETLDTIFSRRSCRHFVAGKAVSAEDIDMLLRAAMAAPTAKNTQPWRFVVVSDKAVLSQMQEGLPFAKMLTSAPVAIVVCGDTTPTREGALKNDLWDQDCSNAAENLLLAAHSMGLGAVWTAAFPYEDRVDCVRAALNLPSHIMPLCVIPVGYPEHPDAPAREKFNPDNIHYNQW